MDDLTRFLNEIDRGKRTVAARDLLPLIYQELRQVAAKKIAHEGAGHTLQATALVHEAWLRLGGEDQGWLNRAHFFGAAAEAMRRILIDRARRKRAVRHGGGLERVDLESVEIVTETNNDELLAVSEALDALATHDPQKAELVKLRYFAGLSLEESADLLGISLRTASRHWTYARSWLFGRIKAQNR